jgi:hypothetical protein
MRSIPLLQAIDQPLNPTLALCPGSSLRGVLRNCIVQIIHAPQAVDDPSGPSRAYIWAIREGGRSCKPQHESGREMVPEFERIELVP